MTAAFESLLPVFLRAEPLISADIQALPIAGITFTMLAGALLLLRGPRPRRAPMCSPRLWRRR